MKKLKILRIFFIFIYSLTHLLTYSLLYSAFEDTGTGARPVSMGNAFFACSDSVYSIYYNPAGIAFLKEPQIVAEYTKFYHGLDDGSDISKGNFSFGLPIKRDYFSVGFGYQKFSFVDVYSEDILRVAFGIKPKNWLGTGVLLKSFSQKYETEKNPYYENHPLFKEGNTTSVFDFDFGFYFEPFKFLSFGLGSGNILQSEYGLSKNSKVKLARNDKFGIMYKEDSLKIGIDFKQINYFYGEKDIKTKSKNEQQLNIGVEKILKPLSVRSGFSWGINYQYKNISVGLGINFSGFEIDYGWVFPLSGIEEISGTHHFSLLAKFGKKLEEKKVSKKEGTEEPTIISTFVVVSPVQEIPVISTITAKPLIEEILSVSTIPAVSVKEELLPVISTKPVEIPIEELVVPSEEISSEIPLEAKISEPVVSPEQKPKEPKPVPSPEVPKKPSVPKVIISGPRTHKVQQGETLISLAEKYYGDKRRWVKIYKANEDKIQKGILKPDTVLVIP
ncbi:MAG: LysM peptidoglycan-binding domain-containing protein [Endomicrobiia bacterium]